MPASNVFVTGKGSELLFVQGGERTIGNAAARSTIVAAAFLALISFVGPAGAAFTLEGDQTSITINEDGKPVLRFVDRAHASNLPPPSPVHLSYIHPLFDPAGRSLTGLDESDGAGVPGIYWCWSECIVGGVVLDMCSGAQVAKVFERRLRQTASSERALVETQHAWINVESGVAFAIETTKILVHPAKHIGRVIDLSIAIANVSTRSLGLGPGAQGGDAGLYVRMNPERQRSATALVSEVLETKGGSWGDLSARIPRSSRYTGVAVFVHPANPDITYPDWTLGQGGSLRAEWPTRRTIELEPGESIEVRYRLYVHLGRGVDVDLDGAFAEYIAEPQ